MGEGTGDKAKGKVDQVAGKAKQAAGSVTGDEKLHAEGHADEAKGKGEGLMGKVKDMAGDAIDTVKGAAGKVGNKVGDVTRKGEATHKDHAHTHEDGTTHTH